MKLKSYSFLKNLCLLCSVKNTPGDVSPGKISRGAALQGG
jgi:hypothetical protein